MLGGWGTAMTSPASSGWWYLLNGDRTGPVSDQELGRLLVNGTLDPNSLVWKQGMDSWQFVAQVQALTHLLPSLPPELPPTSSRTEIDPSQSSTHKETTKQRDNPFYSRAADHVGSLIAVFVIPLMLLNFLSGIVGGVWLAFLGGWNVILFGIGLLLGGVFLISIAPMPSLVFIAPLASERIANSRIGMVPLTLLSVAYIYFVMGVWALSIFWFFGEMVGSNAAIPIVLWSYAIATGVWNYMAQSEYAGLSAIFNQIGCVALIAYTLLHFGDLNPYSMAVWFAVPMIISLAIYVSLVATMRT
jgi:hypothetical protein